MDQFSFSSFLLALTLTACTCTDILPKGPVDAVLGRNVTITPLVEKSTHTVIIWNHHDSTDTTNVVTFTNSAIKYNEPYEGRALLDETTGRLTLRALRADDSGEYGVTFVSQQGDTRAGEITLRVLEPVSDVAIKSNLPEAVEHNSTVVLTCAAKGSFLNFTWMNGATPIKADGKRLSQKDVALSSQLTITGVLRTDLVGPIYCRAGNTMDDETSAPFNLTVYYGPDKVTLTPQTPPPVLPSNANFSLTCSAVSSPPATLTWYHNQTVMEVAGPVLTLDTIKKHGLGKKTEEYSCRAKNEKTQRSVPSSGVSFSVMDPISGVTISGPTGVLIASNSTANISCRAAGGFVTAVAWLKDGKALPAGGRVVFAEDKMSVMISALQKGDNGNYVCQLSNAVSKGQASYKMVVNYGPEAATVAGDKEVELNDPVTLSCSAASVPPANFTWKFNGTLTSVKTATYTIEKPVYKDTGTYVCEAHNDVTGKSSTFTHSLAVRAEGELDSLSDGAIAGIIIGVLLALGAAIGVIMYCRQKVPVESPY
ncbi:carcinoembryonic antigen-related cell adhesion molecule 5 [Brachionichthys hirsutus]|uniref:carcinoembryonic antigen-related cell adhesion molecule 5 n=1 Tax=Brachionichthys hirsutus TaxID=412623 RepID=UPI003604B952